jgi:hypothetical protein
LYQMQHRHHHCHLNLMFLIHWMRAPSATARVVSKDAIDSTLSPYAAVATIIVRCSGRTSSTCPTATSATARRRSRAIATRISLANYT